MCDSSPTKICAFCDEELSTDLFYKDASRKDGLSSRCKSCKFLIRYKKSDKSDHKICTCCDEEKHTEEFHKREAGALGRAAICITCCREKDKERYYEDHEETLRSKREYREDNPEMFKAISVRFKDKHSDRLREQDRQYAKDNPEKFAIKAAKRRARQLDATPLWSLEDELNNFLIDEMYDKSAMLKKLTGVEHHVDHIVPLIAKIDSKTQVACGLHVSWNLQVVPATQNVRKSCYSWPNM